MPHGIFTTDPEGLFTRMDALLHPTALRPAAPPAAADEPGQRPAAPAALTVACDTAAPVTTEFLAFKLGGEEYGIDILRVQEIRSFEKPTRIANAPPHILGVLNLRGLIVPIIDLRLKFQLEQAAYDDFTVTIVLSLGQRVVGIVVDAVSAVISLAPDQLRPVPEMHTGVDSDHLLAIGALDERLLILVDIEALMSSPSMGLSNSHPL